jgi:hypothetical protein
MLEPKAQDCAAEFEGSIGAAFQSLKRLIHDAAQAGVEGLRGAA